MFYADDLQLYITQRSSALATVLCKIVLMPLLSGTCKTCCFITLEKLQLSNLLLALFKILSFLNFSFGNTIIELSEKVRDLI